MIDKFLIPENHKELYYQLHPDRQFEYHRLFQKIKHEEENYIVAVDLASHGSDDYCVMCKMKFDGDKMAIMGIEKF